MIKHHMPYIKHILLILAVIMMAVSASGEQSGKEVRPFVVVLDAGHGGKDQGCRGKSQREKNITLDVALRAGKMIEESLGDSVKVVYTRTDDRAVALQDRASIANDAGADLFVSVHVNSIDRRSKGREKVHGASVYTVGLHKSEANLEVAMRENAVIELENDFSTTYQGFDPNSSESYIIFELTQNRHMEKSVEFASLVKDGLVKSAGRADKGVRQAGFLVLWATRMPSVLIELDFICNPSAERFLGSSEGRAKCAKAISSAVKDYRSRHVSIKNNKN